MSDIKLIIGGILLAVLVIAAGVFAYEHHEVKVLTQATAVDKTTIADQAQSVSEAQATVVTVVKSAAITEATQAQAASDTTATTTAVATIVTTRKTQEQLINEAYANIGKPVKKSTTTATAKTAAVPTTPSAGAIITVGKSTIDTSKLSQADALSTVRIQSMWQVYCKIDTTSVGVANCVKNQ